jgi:hypothetical protein
MGEQRHGLNSSDVWVIFWEILIRSGGLGRHASRGECVRPEGCGGLTSRLAEDSASVRMPLRRDSLWQTPLCRTDLGNLNLPVDMVAKLDALVRLCSCDCLLI